MKNKFSNAGWIMALILMAILGITTSDGCRKKCPELLPGITTSDTTVLYDTVQMAPVPYPVIQTSHRIDTVPADVDTAAIIRDFFITRMYNTEYVLDSALTVKIMDTVTNNKIVGRSIGYTYVKTTTQIDNTVTVPDKKRAKILLGGSLAYTPKRDSINVYINASLLTRQSRVYTIGYDPFNEAFLGGAQIPISFRKK